MAWTVTEKIIAAHLAGGELPARGEAAALAVDQTLTQDATGTMAYLQFETLGFERVRTELSVSYVDHNTLQEDFKNHDDHRYLQSAAAKYGVWFSRAGNGICHQVHLERFGEPGKTLLGSDSHTPTAGGLAMLAIGAGGLDIAAAMAGSPFHLAMPKIYGVRLCGALRAGASAKDVILELLRRETVKGGKEAVYEYFGAGVAALSVPQRATIANMGAELGATSSLFPSDERTRAFLTERGRGEKWTPLAADEGARYDKIIEIDLDALVPLAAGPHSPDAVVPVAGIAGLSVDQVVIGSCTNSSLDDLAAAAAELDGRVVHPRVEAGIACGSRTTLLAAAQAGILEVFLRSGFRLLESACGPCIGMGFAPKSGGVSLRTFNRNFKGRSGTADASVYLVSPQTAALAAVEGAIAVPGAPAAANALAESALAESAVAESIRHADDMLIAPLPVEEARRVELERGPNIKPCPALSSAEDEAALPVLFKGGDNITTDDIMPAGAKVLPLRSNIPEIARFTLHALAPDFYEKARAAGSCALVGGRNWGQGSSREHAALAPRYLGVKAVVAKSFARIHQANLVNYGILPLVFAREEDYEQLREGEILELRAIRSFLADRRRTELTCRLRQSGAALPLLLDLSLRDREILLAGGMIPWIAGQRR